MSTASHPLLNDTAPMHFHSLWEPFPQAIILDFDGLMVDTEWAIYTSWQRVYAGEGHELPLTLFNQCLGSGYEHWDPAKYLESLTGKSYNWEEITLKRQQELEEELTAAGLLAGIKDLIFQCQTNNIPLGVASSSSRRWVQGWLEQLGIYSFFSAVVCRTDGFPVKPAPDLFLETARQLNTSPQHCLVFEDSLNGVTAAHNAGMRCIAIPNRVTSSVAPFLHAHAHLNSMQEALPIPFILSINIPN